MATRGVHWALPIGMLAVIACGEGGSPARPAFTSEAGSLTPSNAAYDPPALTWADAGAEAASTTMPPPLVAPEGVEALTAFDGLPLLQLDGRSRHASSYDRTGGNVDWKNALGTDAAGDQILLDARGPGCVYRIWFTGFAATDRIHVYFDDEPTARIDLPLAALFSGQSTPFTAPLVGNDQISSGGFFSYVPLPFATSLRITATTGTSYFYNIDYHSLPLDAAVTSWTGAEDLSTARSVWAGSGVDPKPDSASATDGATFDLAPGATQVLLDRDGPSELTSIEMKLPGAVRAPGDAGVDAASLATDAPDGAADALTSGLLDALWVSVAWDGESVPSVLAPVGSLFALGNVPPTASGGLMAGLRSDGTLYLYFPMPFEKHAHLELVNRGTTAVLGASIRIGSRPFPYPFDTVGTFAAQYSDGPSLSGTDLTLLETSGSGKVVGVVVSEARTMCTQCVVRLYLEGDEHVVVDGARTPVVMGTGTEDFFNGGFYFDQGPFGLPSHGNVAHDAASAADTTSAYRFFVSDSIAFRDHVRFSLQHGPADDVDVQAATLVYYYRQPRARLVQSDAFVVGDAAGEAAHQYRLTNATWSGSFTATFEGELDAQSSTSTGRAHRGSSFFVVQVDPRNAGVVLRRLLNQATGNQRAQVLVDGATVGDWLTPGSNAWHPWREDDFPLPASVTAGKASLSIEVRFVSSDDDWNEFQYVALSQMP